MGYSRAGFDVVGVDIKPQPHYPFEFHRGDAMEVLSAWVRHDVTRLDEFDAIHASPPCQAFTRAGKLRTAQGGVTKALDLIESTRRLLVASGLPWVLENVEGAPIEGLILCGSSFGLGVRRHRIFESNRLLMGQPCRHREQGRPIGVYHRPGDSIPHGGTTARDLAEGQAAMGIDWMTWPELKEAIPPAYTEWIGSQLLASLRVVA